MQEVRLKLGFIWFFRTHYMQVCLFKISKKCYFYCCFKVYILVKGSSIMDTQYWELSNHPIPTSFPILFKESLPISLFFLLSMDLMRRRSLFLCLCIIYNSSCISVSFIHFSIRLLVFFLLIYKTLYIQGKQALCHICCYYCPHFLLVLFHRKFQCI